MLIQILHTDDSLFTPKMGESMGRNWVTLILPELESNSGTSVQGAAAFFSVPTAV